MPRGGVLVSPRSNEYQALVNQLIKQERMSTPSQADMMNARSQELFQANLSPINLMNQPPMVQQTLTQMMRNQAQSPVINQEDLINNLGILSNRIRENQQAQEQKFSMSPEYQFKF